MEKNNAIKKEVNIQTQAKPKTSVSFVFLAVLGLLTLPIMLGLWAPLFAVTLQRIFWR